MIAYTMGHLMGTMKYLQVKGLPAMDDAHHQQIVAAIEKMKSDDGYFTYGTIVWDALPYSMREQLQQLFYQGPVWDGYVVSKQARDALIQYGLAVRCCFMGEQGYTAASYMGGSVVRQGKGDPLDRRRGVVG